MRAFRTAFLLLVLLSGALAAAETLPDGLSGLRTITREEAALLPEPAGSVGLYADGARLPYDEASNTYFIPQSAQTETFDGTIEIAEEPGWEYLILPGEESGKHAAIQRSIGYTIYGVQGENCASSKLIFTSLPALCIETGSGGLPDEDDEPGRLTLFSAEYGAIWVDQTPIEINLRGNTSKRLPKKSYRVKIVDEQGDKQNLSIAGLRSDDDWILNPMYADTSKIREKLGYELWAQINSSGLAAASSRLEYAEVFINGTYWGLYGVQERIDRKQVDASKRSGVLYKVIANDRPAAEELLSWESGDICRGFELEFAGAGIEAPWEPAAAYMAYLDGAEIHAFSGLSVENIIDFGLWAMLAQAHDCHFKNQFLNCVYDWSGHIIYKIPWDLNNTFGDVWENDAEDTNYTDYRMGSLVLDGCFEKLLQSGDPEVYEAVRARWAELRSGPVQAEALIQRAESLHRSIYPAVQRDSRRWPECGMGEGNAANIRDIESFFETTIPRMDEYIANLGTENTEEKHGENLDR